MANDDPDADLELDPPHDPELADPADSFDDPVEPEPGLAEPVDPAADPQDVPQDQPRQPASRGENRISALQNQLRDERTRREETDRRLDALLANRGPVQQFGETPEARAARLANLMPEERMQEMVREGQMASQRDMAALNFRVVDSGDRTAYEAKATVNPLYAKWKSRVETELTTLRNQGQNVEREKLMYYLIGKNAVERLGETKPAQRQQAQRRVAAARTRPDNPGSDVQATRRQTSTLEKRLENQQL